MAILMKRHLRKLRQFTNDEFNGLKTAVSLDKVDTCICSYFCIKVANSSTSSGKYPLRMRHSWG